MIRASIVGASGYTGGDLLRILLFHPGIEIHQVTSERHAGRPVASVHPNLRKICKHKFVSAAELEPCDVLFLGLPHGQMMNRLSEFENLADTLIELGESVPEDIDSFRLNQGANLAQDRSWLTPDKLPGGEMAAVEEACRAHLRSVIKLLRPAFLVGIGAYAEGKLKQVEEELGSGASLGRVLHPSPASPAANRGWAEAATRQFEEMGVW